ncbi:NUDIX domain-containing protein [Patescibacteria group bacterium]|nr:NUDIX domain-containing protein [Patescibacteria group bacterium]
MPDFGVATKAIIFNTKLKKYLVLKKSDIEDINPNTFDMPGGRMEFGEKLEEAVAREAKEETGLDVTAQQVFNAWTFVKKDKDFQLTGIDFLCGTEQGEVELSEEHSGFEWRNAEEIVDDEKYPDWLRKTIEKAENIRVTFKIS